MPLLLGANSVGYQSNWVAQKVSAALAHLKLNQLLQQNDCVAAQTLNQVKAGNGLGVAVTAVQRHAEPIGGVGQHCTTTTGGGISIFQRQLGLGRLVGYVIRNPERRASATGLNDGKGCFVATPFAAPVNDRYPFAIL